MIVKRSLSGLCCLQRYICCLHYITLNKYMESSGNVHTGRVTVRGADVSTTRRFDDRRFDDKPLIDRRFADTGRTFRRRIVGRFDDNPWTSVSWLSAGSTLSCGFESSYRLETWTARFRRLLRFRVGSSTSGSTANLSKRSSAVQSSTG